MVFLFVCIVKFVVIKYHLVSYDEAPTANRWIVYSIRSCHTLQKSILKSMWIFELFLASIDELY